MRKELMIVILASPLLLQAQHQTVHTTMLWAGYYNTLQFNNHWSLLTDVQVRSKNWAGKWSQQLIRTGLNYRLSERQSLVAGLAFFKTSQYTDDELVWKNEWRPWQELTYSVKWKQKRVNHRLRLEERFLQQLLNGKTINEYEYITRLRYRFDLQFPFKSKWMLAVGNEVMVNPEYVSSSRFFDQNRSFAGVGFRVSQAISLQGQYIKQFQWRSNSSIVENSDVIRLNLYHEIHLKKNK